MLSLLAGYLVVAGALTGIGRLGRLVWGQQQDGVHVAPFWPGWAVTLLFLQCWNLVLPIDWRASAILLFAGTIGWTLSWRRVRISSNWPLALMVVLFATAIAALSTADTRNGDSGVYHLSAVAWSHRSRIIPGLGNLNPLLGLQSSHYLFLAALNVGPFAQRVHHLGPGVLIVALAAQSMRGFLATAKRQQPRAAAFFATLLLPIAVDQAAGRDIVSASADLPVSVIGAVTGLALVLLLAEHQKTNASLVELVLLAAAGVTLKLSFAAFFAGLLLAVALSGRVSRSSLFATAAILLVGPGVWAFRSVVLTGYPAYPSTWLGIHVPWRMPIEDVKQVADYVVIWGRSSGGSGKLLLGSMSWIVPWLRYSLLLNRAIVLPISLATLFTTIAAIRGGRFRTPLSAALIPAIASLLFWFATAPDIRFAGAAFWLLPAVALTIALFERGCAPSTALVVAAVYALIAVEPIRSIRLPATVANWELSPAPAPIARKPLLALEESVIVPADGRCWQTAYCTPFPSESVIQLRPDDAASGYATKEGGRILASPGAPARIPSYR